jgi:hypothetical protein
MPRFSRPTVCLIIVAGLFTALHAWHRISDEMASDRLFYVAACWSSPELMRERKELNARTAVDHIRWQRADEIAHAVAEGRMSLLDGAAQLRDMYRAEPRFSWGRFRECYPGATDDERFCRVLILRVRNLHAEDEDESQALAARLEAELQEYLSHGSLHLPE